MFDHSLNKLFSYPLPNSKNTDYHKLGISPEATTSEIREAKREASRKLSVQKDIFEKKMEIVHKELPDLPTLYKRIKQLQEQGKEEDNDKLVELEKEMIQVEKRALLINPNYKKIRDQAKEIEQKIYEINRMKLQNPEERLAYDKSTPPCALLKLEDCDQEIFTSKGRKLALIHLRQELVAFMEEKGEESYHPSDLTRKHFTSDFTYNRIIDGESYG